MKKKSFIVAVITAAALLVIDQITKYLVVSHFSMGESIPLIPGIINLTYIHNRGAAFGVFQNQTIPFILITVFALVLGVWVLYKRYFNNSIMDWAILLIISGGAGNLIDRVFRQGNVVDFIETAFMEFPIFNIADCAVTVGAILMVIYLVFDMLFSKKADK